MKKKLGIKIELGTRFLECFSEILLHFCKINLYYYIIVMTQEVQTRECRC